VCTGRTHSHTPVCNGPYPSDRLPLLRQWNTEKVESFSGEEGDFSVRRRIVDISGGTQEGVVGHDG